VSDQVEEFLAISGSFEYMCRLEETQSAGHGRDDHVTSRKERIAAAWYLGLEVDRPMIAITHECTHVVASTLGIDRVEMPQKNTTSYTRLMLRVNQSVSANRSE
jgi:hypothetical protein